MTDKPTTILVPKGTDAYWEGWATPCGFNSDEKRVLVRTTRTGATGRSDAQYIVDRLASGLHFAEIVEGDK